MDCSTWVQTCSAALQNALPEVSVTQEGAEILVELGECHFLLCFSRLADIAMELSLPPFVARHNADMNVIAVTPWSLNADSSNNKFTFESRRLYENGNRWVQEAKSITVQRAFAPGSETAQYFRRLQQGESVSAGSTFSFIAWEPVDITSFAWYPLTNMQEVEGSEVIHSVIITEVQDHKRTSDLWANVGCALTVA